MDDEQAREALSAGAVSLGIEFGSTRIKGVLIDSKGTVLATGGFDWENQWVDGSWTYPLDEVWRGLQSCYADLAGQVSQTYGIRLTKLGAIGISAMMHGYLAFDADDNLLVPFRTWRNTTTGQASAQLTKLFDFNIPQRWSIAHLYQAVLNGEPHVPRIAHLTTLAGLVHQRLTGQRVLGVGDASGMFPIDSATGTFDAHRLSQFDDLIADRGFGWTLGQILPAVLPAGAPAGQLTADGARLIDPTGTLQPGVLCCPPEGDAGTGMTGTNSVARRTGNISAGTSIFAMVVLERPLNQVHEEIDLVTTPCGDPVAMVHCNNGASEIGEWAGLFAEFAQAAGVPLESKAVYQALFRSALTAAPDGGGLMAYNYLSGEPIARLTAGRPLVARTPGSDVTLGNFMRVQLYSAFATLALGMRILADEGVEVDRMFAHGGLFGTKEVAQRLLAAAIEAPVSVGDTASEGGAWGMAVLAEYARTQAGPTLADFLTQTIFAGAEISTIEPDPADVAGFSSFLDRYAAALPLEQAAVEALPETVSE